MIENALGEINAKALGTRLRLAREARKWTQKVVAEKLGVARTTLVAIEKGDRRLQPTELVQLAKLFGRRLNGLLQQEEPEESFVVQLWGTATPSPEDSDGLLRAIDNFEQLCEDYVRLERLCGSPGRRRYPSTYDLQGVDPELAAEDVAVAERRRLALGDGPLVNLRAILENDVGLRIFLPKLPSAVAGMFAFTETFGGCIAVNANHPLERKRHSLAHEYGHFLTSRFQPEVLYSGRYERRPVGERFAETFGRAFLMPFDGLRRRFLEIQRQRKGAPTVGDLYRLARFYYVSPEAMTRRLEELRLTPAGNWDRLNKHLGLSSPKDDGSLLPSRFVALAVESWQKDELSEGQLARILRTDRLGAREILSA
jgi:Zn-dependent peptidase ImmA (M78 family)/transcriptional regulator with XRE-family HTH domain